MNWMRVVCGSDRSHGQLKYLASATARKGLSSSGMGQDMDRMRFGGEETQFWTYCV